MIKTEVTYCKLINQIEQFNVNYFETGGNEVICNFSDIILNKKRDYKDLINLVINTASKKLI